MPYSVKGFVEINKDMVQILLMCEMILFTQDSKVEDLLCDAPSGFQSSLFFRNYLFGLGLNLFKMISRIILLE